MKETGTNHCMTDMQLIVPPLEDNGNQGDESDVEQNKNGGGNTVLSNELRERFETMQTVWRRARRSSGDDVAELRRKEQRVALDTAVAIESEMRMWQNGIAELEAMLAEEEGNEDHDYASYEEIQVQPLEAVRFPSLPPVIPADEEDIDNCDAEENTATTTDL